MPLTSTIQSAVNSLFNGLGDLVLDISLAKVHTNTYDPDSGSIDLPPTTYDFKGIFDDVKGSSFSNTLIDFTAKICYLNPDADNPDPEIGDKIYASDGVKFTIMDIAYNKPGNDVFVWELLVRA